MKTSTTLTNSALLLFSLAFICIIVDQYFNLGRITLDTMPGGMLGFFSLWIILNMVRITILLMEIRDRLK